MAQSTTAHPKNYYPKFVIPKNEHPNRWLNIPFIGIAIRLFLSIPLFFVLIFIALFYFVLWLITPFYILFTGKYWDTAYKYTVIFLTYSTKVTAYFYGLTDKYPGFNLGSDGLFTLHIEKPSHPSRFLAFPLIGFLIRFILLIPYTIFASVMKNGAQIGVFAAWFVILFKGKYPESLQEFAREYIRVSTATSVYMAYLSDLYPSFHIVMKNRQTKIVLLILGALLTLFGSVSDIQRSVDEFNKSQQEKNMQYNFENLPIDYNSY